jgi:hypothetical protein
VGVFGKGVIKGKVIGLEKVALERMEEGIVV